MDKHGHHLDSPMVTIATNALYVDQHLAGWRLPVGRGKPKGSGRFLSVFLFEREFRFLKNDKKRPDPFGFPFAPCPDRAFEFEVK